MNSQVVDARDPSVLADLVESVFRRIETGQSLDLDQLTAEAPEYRDRLAAMLPILRELKQIDLSAVSGALAVDGLTAGKIGTLGDYRVLRQIGRGGMGIVYEAEQLSIPRRVALKILPLAALVDPRALQRFKNEVAAIATLEHPNIVPVYGVGDERGMHYYAMKLVRGQSLAAVIRELRARADRDEHLSGEAIQQAIFSMAAADDVADAATVDSPLHASPALGDRPQSASPPLRGRGQGEGADQDTLARGRSKTLRPSVDQTYFRNVARLIRQAAEAIQHAHVQGIVHRDIKPGNLLLDSSGTLYVTDFGLARMEASPGVTMTGDMLGTLRYMSPEQIAGNRLTVDHRTDIYSLGATLYELLTLQPMWTGEDKAELIRQISFNEPARPQRINNAVPLDLETIALKAINKNPTERYETAQAMADDLYAFLQHKTILARRPSVVQHIDKWARRHPTLVWTSALFLIAMTIGMVISFGLIRMASIEAKNQRLRAEHSLDQALKAVDSLLTNVADNALLNLPGATRLREQIYQSALDISMSLIDVQASGPEVELRAGAAHLNIGTINCALGHLDRAEMAFREAINKFEAWLEEFEGHALTGECHWRLATALHNLSLLLARCGNTDGAIAIFDSYREHAARVIAGDANIPHLFYVQNAEANIDLASLYLEQHRYDAALFFYHLGVSELEHLAASCRENVDLQVRLAWSHGHLGVAYKTIGNYDKAMIHLEKAERILIEFQSQASDIAFAKKQLVETDRALARIYLEINQAPKAKAFVDRVLSEARSLRDMFPQDPVHSSLLADALDLEALLAQQLGEPQQALDLSHNVIGERRRIVAQFPSEFDFRNKLAWSLHNASRIQFELGLFDQALRSIEEAIDERRRLVEELPGPEYQRALTLDLKAGAGYLCSLEKYDQAVNLARQAVKVATRLCEDHKTDSQYMQLAIDCQEQVGVILLDSQDFALAKEELDRAIEMTNRLDGPSDSIQADDMVMRLQANVATCYCGLGQFSKAKEIYLQYITSLESLMERTPKAQEPRMNCAAMYENLRLLCLQGENDLSEASLHCESALRIYKDLSSDYPEHRQLRSLVASSALALSTLRSRLGQSDESLEALELAKEYGCDATPEQIRKRLALTGIKDLERLEAILSDWK